MSAFQEKIAEEVKKSLLSARFTSRNQLSSGRVFFVLKTAATNYTQFKEDHPDYKSFDGVTTVSSVYNTIDAAVGACTADQGDVIYVMPGHTESLTTATSMVLDVAGISVIGIGEIGQRPVLTIDTATTAKIHINAAGILLKNFEVSCEINDLAQVVDVDYGNFTMEDCKIVSVSAKEALNFVNLATTKDNFIIRGCTFLQPSDPDGTGAAVNTGAIYLVDSENILIEDCIFRGQFESGIIHNKTTACKGLVVRNCELSNELTVPFLLVVTAEGVCDNCYGATLVASDNTEAQVFGTIGTIFWISQSTSLGNDSGAGEQGGIKATVAS